MGLYFPNMIPPWSDFERECELLQSSAKCIFYDGLGWAKSQEFTQETCYLQILVRLLHLWDFRPLPVA